MQIKNHKKEMEALVKKSELLNRKMETLIIDVIHLGNAMEKTLIKYREVVGQEINPTYFETLVKNRE